MGKRLMIGESRNIILLRRAQNGARFSNSLNKQLISKNTSAIFQKKKVEAVSPDELHTAKTQINALSQYFDNAVVVAKKAAEHDALEQEAIAYAEQDRVCRDILRQSEWTYGKNRCRARAVAARKHRGHQAG